ncbi:MmgE/PrpD family protein [Shinella sp.]|uniref:MmgE/PrpD family protein n=1 Tax=Shinella sp. TaxID=1870904 RepID=UPI003F71EEF2
MEYTRLLSSYVAASRFEDIPDDVRHEGLRSFLNWLGCAIGGSSHETVDRTLAALLPLSPSDKAGILGRHERIDVLNAALINGISGHVLDFDDTHLKTIIHPAGPVAAAILAYAELRPVSGIDFLHAFILGVDVECRIGNSVYPAHYDIGWHITGTAGVFGAAAAVGKLMNLDAQKMAWALGIAGTQSSGFREMFGTMCKSYHAGHAAQCGLKAALLAEQGFTSSERVLEAPRGFAAVTSTKSDLTEITRDLGKTFEISLNTYKPFACGIVIHPIIDGCIQLRNEHGLKAAQIAKIELRVHPLVLELTGKTSPQSGLEGKFSVFHSAAVAIIRGMAGAQEYSDDAVRDEETVALRTLISAEIDPNVAEDEAFLKVTLTDGRVIDKHVEHAIGSLEHPMSDTELEQKFSILSNGVVGDAVTRQLIELSWSLAALDDVAQLSSTAALPTRDVAAE